jgi:hypothetical protein
VEEKYKIVPGSKILFEPYLYIDHSRPDCIALSDIWNYFLIEKYLPIRFSRRQDENIPPWHRNLHRIPPSGCNPHFPDENIMLGNLLTRGFVVYF